MNSDKNTPRLLGAAFLLQAVASAVGGLVLAPVDLLEPSVSGNISDTMTIIANNALQMRASIVVEMICVIGVIMLGSLLFVTLKKQNGKIALVALGLYLIEVALLAVRELLVFSVLRISQVSVIAGHPAYLQTLGNLFFDSQSFGYSLLMLPFALGATLFYYLFYKSGFIPRSLNLLGLIAAPLAFIGTLFELLGYAVPIVVFLPNLPFELGVGLWLLVKGFNTSTIITENVSS
jgi:hypothetical protein